MAKLLPSPLILSIYLKLCVIQELSSERQADKQNLLVELSRARTSLIKLEGEAKHKRTEMEAFMKQRRRRIEDIKMYQVKIWMEDLMDYILTTFLFLYFSKYFNVLRVIISITPKN